MQLGHYLQFQIPAQLTLTASSLGALWVLRFHFFADQNPELELHQKEPELEVYGSGSKFDQNPHIDSD